MSFFETTVILICVVHVVSGDKLQLMVRHCCCNVALRLLWHAWMSILVVSLMQYGQNTASILCCWN